jgi:hypothetical protein
LDQNQKKRDGGLFSLPKGKVFASDNGEDGYMPILVEEY